MEPLPLLPPEVLAEDRSATVIGVVSMCFFLSLGILGLRMWTRIHIVKKTGPDDWAACFSQISVLGCGLAEVTMTRYGLGKHEQAIPMGNFVKFYKCFWVSVLFYSLGQLSFKMSFLLQYYRVLVTSHMRKFYLGAMAVIGLWGLSVVIMTFVFCIPLDGFWDLSVSAKCLPPQVLFYAFGACSVVTDIIIFLLPLPGIFKLKLPRAQKWYLLGIFSLGFLIVAISILRLQFLQIKPDFTYWNVTPALWSQGELTAAQVCLCLPTLKALAVRMGWISSKNNTSPSKNPINGGASAPMSVPRKFDASQPASPCEKPVTFGTFVVETDPSSSEQDCPSKLPPV